MTGPGAPRVSVVVPAYEEGERIVPHLRRLFEAISIAFEVIVVVDRADDTTVPHLVDYGRDEPRLRSLVNEYGPGPARAIRYGIDQARSQVVVVTMADGSDDPHQIDKMAQLVERGVAIAVASRYMRGGQQLGGPLVKTTLSRLAGLTLRWLARVGTHDATNSFKAYSVPFVRNVGIESDSGFEVGIELVAKARRLRMPVAEIPTIWLDRAEGTSNFRLTAWIPRYLRWYWFAFGRQMSLVEMRQRSEGRLTASVRKEGE